MREKGLDFHTYADDTQIYLAFNPRSESECHAAVRKLEAGFADIKEWMTCNMLKLNKEKTEVLLVTTKPFLQRSLISSISFGGIPVTPSDSVRSLGVVLDSHLNMEKHVNAVCRSCYLYLRGIARVRSCLDQHTAETIVHALVSTRLDYCNSLLFGISGYLLQRLQRVQNFAARVVCQLKRVNHITPILRQLHWLPVYKRIDFKVILITFKVLNGMSPQ